MTGHLLKFVDQMCLVIESGIQGELCQIVILPKFSQLDGKVEPTYAMVLFWSGSDHLREDPLELPLAEAGTLRDFFLAKIRR